MVLALTKRRFTADEYQRMGEAGILGEDDRVELIEGDVVELTPVGRRHAACVRRASDLLTQRWGAATLVSVQRPIHLNAYNEPRPDLALLRYPARHAVSGHATVDEIVLLVEVADSSVEVDREVKIPLYARAGIREVWLVDLTREEIVVYREPAAFGYRRSQAARRGGELAPESFPEQLFAVTAILGEGTLIS